MANPTTIECLKYLQSKGESDAERQQFFDTAPYVLKAQVISAQRKLKQSEANFIVKAKNETRAQCIEREKMHLQEEIDQILETCVDSIYKGEVKNIIIGILKSLPPHDEKIEQVNEKAGAIYKEFTGKSKIEESKALAKEIKLSGDVYEMRAQMDMFLNRHLADKLAFLKSKTQHIYVELMKEVA